MKNTVSKSIIVIFAMIMGVSCVKKETFNLVGTVKDTPEGELLIYKINDNKMDTLAYTTFANGKFEINSLRSPIEEATLATIILRPKRSENPKAQIIYKKIPVILDNVNIDALFSMDSSNQIFEGSPFHKRVIDFDNSNPELILLKSAYENDLNKYQELINSSAKKEEIAQGGKTVRASFKKYSEKKNELILESLNNSDDALYKAFLLAANAILLDPSVFVEQANKVLAAVEPLNKSIYNDLLIQKGKYENQLKASVGNTYTDFSVANLQGVEMKLSDAIKENQYVLLDFWASWCGPCRAEVPNLKKVYSTYNAKGFGIFMVSIDKDKAKWEEASTEENLPWTNGLDRNGVQGTYAVSFIPQNFLIDKNGTIVGKNLSGKALNKKLEELLSNE